MRILCFTIPEKGHLNPLLPTLRRLALLGHEVVVAASRDLSPQLAAAGFPARFVLLSLPPPPASFVTSGAGFAEKLRDARWLASWIEALLIDAVPAQIPAICAVLTGERPDVVVADPMLYAVAIACAQAEQPWAALSSSLNPVTPRSWHTALTETLARLSERRAALFHERALPVPRFFVSDAESPWLNLAFSAPAYLPEPADPAIQLVGAPFADSDVTQRGDESAFAWARLAAGMRVYCSFGSQAFFQPQLFRRVFDAARTLGVQLIASVGDLIDDAAFVASAPKNAILARYTPQLEVLRVVDLVISHGGANSVVEALANGRPLLLLTLCNDQPLQARFLESAGAGLAIDAARGDVDPTLLSETLAKLITGGYRTRAESIAEALRAAGGPNRAAELVLKLARSRKPVVAETRGRDTDERQL